MDMSSSLNADAKEFVIGGPRQESKGPAEVQYGQETKTSKLVTQDLYDGVLGNLNIIVQDYFYTLKLPDFKWSKFSSISNKCVTQAFKYAAATHIQGNKFMITGGLHFKTASSIAYLIDVNKQGESLSDYTQRIQDLIVPRILHSMVTCEGVPFVIGGQSDINTYLGDVEKWVDGRWMIAAKMNTPRSTFAVSANGPEIYVAGGFIGVEQIASDIEVYDFAGNFWTPLQVEHQMLAGMCMIEQKRNEFLLIGGSDGEEAQNRVIKFNSSSRVTQDEGLRLQHPRAKAVGSFFKGKIRVMFGGVPNMEELGAGGFQVFEDQLQIGAYEQIFLAHFNKKI